MFQYNFTERTVPVSVPGKRFWRFRFHVRFLPKTREVLHGVGADGVRMKFPTFAANCCRQCLPLFF